MASENSNGINKEMLMLDEEYYERPPNNISGLPSKKEAKTSKPIPPRSPSP